MQPSLIVDGMPSYRVHLGPDPMGPLLSTLFPSKDPTMQPPIKSINILYPETWERKDCDEATSVLLMRYGCPVTWQRGDTDAPCVDCVPMGRESEVSAILDGM